VEQVLRNIKYGLYYTVDQSVDQSVLADKLFLKSAYWKYFWGIM